MPASRDPWQWLEARSDDLRVRVARSRADARAARDLIGEAWPILDADRLYERIIVTSRTTCDLRELDGLCMIIDGIDDAGRSVTVGTFSFAFDHHARTIEVGRGAIIQGRRRREIAELALAPIRRVIALLPTYAAVTDVTTLSRGAAQLVAALELSVVAIHPSNASVSSEAIGAWHERLSERGSSLAESLVRESAATGLGRFMTCHHIRRPAAFAPYRPALTRAQWPFYAHTCRAMDLDPDAPATMQRARLRSTSLRDRTHTATRTIIDPPRALDVHACVAASLREGFETLVVQVACDPQHQAVSGRLEQAGAILGGVIVDARGYWRASYTVPTTVEHAAVVRSDLARLAESQAFDPPLLRLLQLTRDGASSVLDRAS